MLDGNDILGSETEKPQSSDIISCEICKKYKTAGYERRIRNVHTSKENTVLPRLSVPRLSGPRLSSRSFWGFSIKTGLLAKTGLSEK